jgi:aminoglycoside phosphotransferase family enzyme/predicted kinase
VLSVSGLGPPAVRPDTDAPRSPGTGTLAGDPEPGAAVTETHSAVVLFVGDRAYKLKKRVAFGFLDFTTVEGRGQACEREVALNRRLAPDVYLGVLDIVGSDGVVCDHLVAMRRLPAARRLSTLVTSGSDVGPELRRLARVMADFHARAERSPAIDVSGTGPVLLERWEASLREATPLAGRFLERDRLDRVATLGRRYLAGRFELLAERVAAGRTCDGHGDLLAEDIFCLDDGPRVLDCLEFDDKLRYGDVAADVAFCAMDLEHLGAPDAATAFLAHYRELSGDSWPSSLTDFYVGSRALVRATVRALRAEQGEGGAVDEARRHLAQAESHLERGRVRLVVVGGAPGTGKSTVAAELGDALGAVVLRSDELRKQRAGLDIVDAGPVGDEGGLYRSTVTDSTYSQLLDEARSCLEHGLSVVLDATFRDPRWRARARTVAVTTVADLDEVRCTAPPGVVAARVARRAGDPGNVSDATDAVALELAASEPPWPSATTLDTSRRPVEVEAAVRAIATGSVGRRQLDSAVATAPAGT